MEKMRSVGNVSVLVQAPLSSEHLKGDWLGDSISEKLLSAAWFMEDENDSPMNPKIVGKPGVGKTTLAVQTAKNFGLPVFLMQCTSDTKPEDLLISPVISENQTIKYVCSPLVSAMLLGGICILDEGNRMSEKSWASLAPLLDHRRYVDSVLLGERISAHKQFRFVTTMNDDSSVFQIPEYIESRLSPQIVLDSTGEDALKSIFDAQFSKFANTLNRKLVLYILNFQESEEYVSPREGLQVLKLAQKMLSQNPAAKAEAVLQDAWKIVTHLDVPAIEMAPGGKISPIRPL